MDTLRERMDTAHMSQCAAIIFLGIENERKYRLLIYLKLPRCLSAVYPFWAFIGPSPALLLLIGGKGPKQPMGFLSKIPYSFAALTSRFGNVIAHTHHRFENSRQLKPCFNSLRGCLAWPSGEIQKCFCQHNTWH